MEQMKMNGLDEIKIDYQSSSLPETVRKLKPALYKDGNSFCCLLGPDPQEGIFGCGETEEEALLDWDTHVKDRAIRHPYGDKIAEFIVAKLSAI